jgi:hypothetical protein
MGVTYEKAPGLIRKRVAVIYGTQAHLARQLGISRQALAVRVRSTLASGYLHEWWERLLLMKPGSLAAGVEPAEHHDAIRAAVALREAVEVWPSMLVGRYYYPSPARLAGNARRRGPRVKQDEGCEPQGGVR